MAIVAGKRGGTRPRGDGVTRWKRVVPLAAAVLLVLAAVLAWRLGAARSESSPQQEGNGDVAPPVAGAAAHLENSPHNADGLIAESAAARTESQPRPADEAQEPQSEPTIRLVPGHLSLPDGRVLTFKPPAEGTTTKVFASGHTYEAFPDGSFRDITPRKLFDTPFENQFQNVMVDGHISIATFLVGLDEDKVIELLRKPVVFEVEDTDEERETKEAMVEMKQAALDYIEAGGTFDEFITESETFVKQERSLKAKGLRSVMERYKEGDYAGARERAEAVNAALEEQGFRKITFPPHVKAALGLDGGE